MHSEENQSDPVFASSLGELKWVLVIWLINFLWVVGYCILYGYPSEGQPLDTVIGMPSWVFWGIFVPWIVATAVTSWFALTQIEDHPLEELSSEELSSRQSGSETGDE